MAAEGTGIPDDLTTASLMRQSKRRLAETIQAQCRLAELRNYEWATAVWEAGLLAAQRQELIRFLAEEMPVAEDASARYTSWVIDRCREILTTDPRDGTRE